MTDDELETIRRDVAAYAKRHGLDAEPLLALLTDRESVPDDLPEPAVWKPAVMHYYPH